MNVMPSWIVARKRTGLLDQAADAIGRSGRPRR